MAFRKEITGVLSPLKFPSGLIFTVIDGAGGYFENVLKIGELSTYSVTFLTKGGVFKVNGKDIKIVKYCDGDLVLKGTITGIERCE